MNKTLKNDRGAVMVMAVFVAMLLVGVLYHVAGVGGAALEQQTMQDAADATAFSAATVHARGMNIIAMLNLIMVALLTILVALRLVQTILTILLAAATVCSFVPVTSAACASLVSPLANARSRVDDAADAYQRLAKRIIKGLSKAEDAVNKVVPIIALGEGVAVSTGRPYDKVSDGGVVWPIFEGLPTKKGEYSELCERAGKNIAAPIGMLLPDGIDVIADVLSEMTGELTETFSAYFCGDDSSGGSSDKPQDKTVKKEVGYPPGLKDDEDNAAMWGCAEIRPDGQSGKCYDSNCKDCAKVGCDFCLARMKAGGNYKRGQWTIVRNDWVEWIDADGVTQKIIARDTSPDRWSVKTVDGNPCLHDDNPNENSPYYNGSCSGYGQNWGYHQDGYNLETVPEKENYYPKPICERIKEEPVEDQSDISYYLQKAAEKIGKPPSDDAVAGAPEMTLKQQTIYLALTSCVVKEKIDVKVEGEPMIGPGEDKSDYAPRVLDTEKFPKNAKITSILVGKRKVNDRLKIVAIASEEKPDNKTEKRFAFASADYYSQNKDKESMWQMKWLSRLARFQWSDGDGGGQDAPQDIKDNNSEGLGMMSDAKSSLSDKLGVSVDDYLLH